MNRGQSSPSSNESAVPETAPLRKEHRRRLRPRFCESERITIAGPHPPPLDNQQHDGQRHAHRREEHVEAERELHLHAGGGQRRHRIRVYR